MNIFNKYSQLMKIAEWVTRLAYVNLLWLVFTVFGLLVLGLMPATAAMFAIHRQWYRGEEDFKVFSSFLSHYKAFFWEANGIGLCLLIAGGFIYTDIRLLSTVTNWLTISLLIVLLVVSYMFMGVLIHIFTVFVHFKIRFIDYFKYSFYFSVFQPIKTFFLGVGITLLVLLIMTFPPLILVGSGSLISFFLIWSSLTGYSKLLINT